MHINMTLVFPHAVTIVHSLFGISTLFSSEKMEVLSLVIIIVSIIRRRLEIFSQWFVFLCLGFESATYYFLHFFGFVQILLSLLVNLTFLYQYISVIYHLNAALAQFLGYMLFLVLSDLDWWIIEGRLEVISNFLLDDFSYLHRLVFVDSGFLIQQERLEFLFQDFKLFQLLFFNLTAFPIKPHTFSLCIVESRLMLILEGKIVDVENKLK